MTTVVHKPGPLTVDGELPQDVAEQLAEVVAAAVARALARVPMTGEPTTGVPTTGVPTTDVSPAGPAEVPVRVPELGLRPAPETRPEAVPAPGAETPTGDDASPSGAELLRRLVPTPAVGASIQEGRAPVEGALVAQLDPDHSVRYINLRSSRWVSAANLTEALALARLEFPEASFGVVQGPIGAKRQRYLALATDPVVGEADFGETVGSPGDLGPELEGRAALRRGVEIKGTIPGRDGQYLVRGLVAKDDVPFWRNAAVASMWVAQLADEAERGLEDPDPEAQRVALFDDVDALLDPAEAGDAKAVEKVAGLLAHHRRDAFALVDWETKTRYVKILLAAWTFDAEERAIVEILASLRTPTEFDAVVGLLRAAGLLEALFEDLDHRRYELLSLVGHRFGTPTGGLTLAELGVLMLELGLFRPSLAGMITLSPDGELRFELDALLAEARAAVLAVGSFLTDILELLETILTEPGKLARGLAGLAQLLVTFILAHAGYPPAQQQIATLMGGAGRSVLDGARGARRMSAGDAVLRVLRWGVVLTVASMVVGPGEIKAAIGAVGVSEKLAGALRILAWLGRAIDGAAAERVALRLARLLEVMRLERTALGTADELGQLIAHLPKRDAQELMRLLGKVDVVEGETLAQLAARSSELHDAVRQVMTRAEVLKSLAVKAGGLSEEVAAGFARLVSPQRAGSVEAAARIVAALEEGQGAAFLRLLETPMTGMEVAERVRLMEFAASSGKRLAMATEYGTDVFRAVGREAGWTAAQVEQTYEVIAQLRARAVANGRADEFARLMERAGRQNESAWQVIDEALAGLADPRRAEVQAEFLAQQARAGSVVSDAEALAALGVTSRDRILGKLVDRFELGNFAHRWAELLIPESLLPRGLRAEFSFQLPDGSWRRIDRIDFKNGWLYEVKPKGSLEAGQAQGKLYAQWLDAHPIFRRPDGAKWNFKVVTYDYERLQRALEEVGELARWIKGGGG